MDPEEWKALEKKGYSGGLILYEGMSVDSLDDKTMADLGWIRHPEWKGR